MGQYTVTFSPEEEKAMLTDMLSIQDWMDNAGHNKARQRIDAICKEALGDRTDTILTKGEKHRIVAKLAADGQIISTVKQMPPVIKAEIVQKARVKSAAEKKAESEAEMAGPVAGEE